VELFLIQTISQARFRGNFYSPYSRYQDFRCEDALKRLKRCGVTLRLGILKGIGPGNMGMLPPRKNVQVLWSGHAWYILVHFYA